MGGTTQGSYPNVGNGLLQQYAQRIHFIQSGNTAVKNTGARLALMSPTSDVAHDPTQVVIPLRLDQHIPVGLKDFIRLVGR